MERSHPVPESRHDWKSEERVQMLIAQQVRLFRLTQHAQVDVGTPQKTRGNTILLAPTRIVLPLFFVPPPWIASETIRSIANLTATLDGLDLRVARPNVPPMVYNVEMSVARMFGLRRRTGLRTNGRTAARTWCDLILVARAITDTCRFGDHRTSSSRFAVTTASRCPATAKQSRTA